jgi:O-antigen ligase
LLLALSTLAVALGLFVGVSLGAGRPGPVAILVLGTAGLALGALALLRLEVFLLAVLSLRASLDYFQVSERIPIPVEPAQMVALLFMVAAALWLAGNRREAVPAPPSTLRAPLLAFLCGAALSVIGSAQPGTSILDLSRITAVVIMLVVLERLLTDPAAVKRLLIAVFLSALLPLALGIMQALQGEGVDVAGFNRVRGTFLHPNTFAVYLALIVVMGAALYPHLKTRWRRPALVFLGACGSCLLLTYTRGAWLAAFVGLIIVGILQSRTLIAVLLGGTVLLAVAVPSVSARFSDLEREQRPSGAAGNSLIWRFDYWSDALSLVKENPVTGIGLKMVQSRSEGEQNVHNDFVRVLVETGLIGLAAYLWLLARLRQVARRSLATAAPGLHRGVAVGFSGCLGVFLVVSMSANIISQVVLLWYFVAFAAVAMAVGRPAAVPSEATL